MATSRSQLSESEFIPGSGSQNNYIYSPISRKVGRLLGNRVPKNKIPKCSISESWKAMDESYKKIMRGKELGIVPSWIYCIRAFGNAERSEKRGKITVEHIEGINMWDEMNINNPGTYTRYYQQIAHDFLRDIHVTLSKIGIETEDLGAGNIMILPETLGRIREQCDKGESISLGIKDKIWVNMDPDGWIFKDLQE